MVATRIENHTKTPNFRRFFACYFAHTVGMDLLDKAKKLQEKYVEIRRKLHRNAETGFDLPNTKRIVWDILLKLGYSPKEIGNGGVIAVLGGEKTEKAILLRLRLQIITAITRPPVKQKRKFPFGLVGLIKSTPKSFALISTPNKTELQAVEK